MEIILLLNVFLARGKAARLLEDKGSD